MIAAQVADGAWEAAAGVEDSCSADWYGTMKAMVTAAKRTNQSRGVWSRVPTSEVTCRIAAARVSASNLTGRPAEAAALVNELIPAADQPGLELGRAVARSSQHGASRPR